jgi:hypothetical protein
MKVIEVPPTMDYRSLDGLIAEVAEVREGKVLFDARRLRWVDPAGMIALLALGQQLRSRTGEPPALQLPEGGDVPGYLARMAFFDAAHEIFRLEDRPPRRAARASEILLEVTPIQENRDVHELVERVQERAAAILGRTLHLPPTAVVPFAVILSEVCQNILEHAEGPGWVAAQTYHWSRRLGRQVLVLAVGDVGRGFRGSLSAEYSGRYGSRWNDATALEAAFIHGMTRFPDQGRGHGIQQIRKQVRRWGGLMTIRSGEARISDVPEWEDLPPLESGLPPIVGSWITLILPARAEEGGG